MKNTAILGVIADLVFLPLALLIMVWLMDSVTIRSVFSIWKPFVAFAVLWILISLANGKFINIPNKTISQVIVGVLITGISMALILIILDVFYPVRRGYYRITLGVSIIVMIFETTMILYLLFLNKYRLVMENNRLHIKTGRYYENGVSVGKLWDRHLNTIVDQSEKLHIQKFTREIEPGNTATKALSHDLIESKEGLVNFIQSATPINNIPYNHARVLNTRALFNLQTVEENYFKLFVNLHRLNDIKRITEFLNQVNKNLVPGGYFVGCSFTMEQRKREFMTKFKKPVGKVYYFFDFLIYRFLPKMPYLKIVYFAFSKGEGKILSMAEVLGRLVYSGFEICNIKTIDGYMFFVARKIKLPMGNEIPSYGPILKMKRVGKNGNPLIVYKIRTMHPFSEFLQSYVFDLQGSRNGDKPDNDFRIATWGRVIRRLFIDEIPMIINLYRGEVKLIGVRPLSCAKFMLYNKELQEKRTRHKPGLIPPFYYDMPQSFDELMESENRYLDAYEKHPFLTDWRYFWRAMFNIVMKGARSK